MIKNDSNTPAEQPSQRNVTNEADNNDLISEERVAKPYKKGMSGNCHRNCPESVRVYMGMSGKCQLFVLKNDQACYSDLFRCPEYVQTIFFIQRNVRNVYGIFSGIIFSYKKMSGMCTEFLEGSFFHTKKCPECVRNF